MANALFPREAPFCQTGWQVVARAAAAPESIRAGRGIRTRRQVNTCMKAQSMMTFTIGRLERWLQTGWFFTAVLVLLQMACARGLAAAPATNSTWVDAWAVSYLSTTVNGTLQAVPTFNNQTLRMNLFAKLGGTALRVKFTDRFATNPVVIGEAHVALRSGTSGSAIVKSTDHRADVWRRHKSESGGGGGAVERSGELGGHATPGRDGQRVPAAINKTHDVSPHCTEDAILCSRQSLRRRDVRVPPRPPRCTSSYRACR